MAEVTDAIGQRLGRYTVVGKLGGGGMGAVYRARDAQLDRDVAIKLLPADNRRYLQGRLRLEQEALLVGALDHPNILTVHDLGEHEGTAYLVMELLEGETLRELIREQQGGLGWRRSLEYAVQVARGLAAIHERDIVHRDLKPHNLFVTRDSYVKILDFGLAKAPRRDVRQDEAIELTPKPDSGQTGVMIGTVAYMSPEQVAGKELDHRSDLFAFGVVLYEMLAGRHPFRIGTAAECLVGILDKEPPELAALDPKIPEPLVRMVDRCLAKRPNDRYQSARELAGDLQTLRTGGSPVVTKDNRARLRFPALSRRVIGLAAGCLISVATLLLAFWVLTPRGSARARFSPAPGLEHQRVAVFPLENLTGEPGLDGIGVSAATLIANSLCGSSELEAVLVDRSEVLSRQRRRGGAFHQEALLAVAKSNNAATVVAGACSWVGLKLQLEAWVIDAQQGKLIRATIPVSASAESPQKALEMLRKRVAALTVWHLSNSVYLLANPVPPRWEAYQELAIALGLGGGSAIASVEQIPHLDRAQQLDPDLLGAGLAKAAALLDDGSRFAEAAVLLERLRESGSRLSPFGREILACREAQLQGSWAAGLQHCLRAQELKPRADLRYQIAVLARQANRPQEAVAVMSGLRAACDSGLQDPNHLGVLTQALHMLGRYEEELQEAWRARELFPDQLSARSQEIRALVALGRVAEARQRAEASMAAPARRAWDAADVLWRTACELREHGHHEAGLEVAEQAINWLESLPTAQLRTWGHRWALAGALYQAERWSEAETLYRSMAEEVGQIQSVLCQEDKRLVWLHGTLGVLAARRGDREEALRISAHLEQIGGYPMGGHTYGRARVAAQLGEREQALGLLRLAFAQGMAFSPDVYSDPDLEPLWHHPELEALLRPEG